MADVLQVKNNAGDFPLEVLLLSETHGPAAVAQTLYPETEASRKLRLKLLEERKAMPYFEALREGEARFVSTRNLTHAITAHEFGDSVLLERADSEMRAGADWNQRSQSAQ